MARKFAVSAYLQDDGGNSHRIEEFVVEADDESSAVEVLTQRLADEAEASVVTATYEVTIEVRSTYRFTFEDEEGEYADENEVGEAVGNGDIDYTDFVSLDCPDDTEVYDVSVEVEW